VVSGQPSKKICEITSQREKLLGVVAIACHPEKAGGLK
jgi:hypothetical protein